MKNYITVTLTIIISVVLCLGVIEVALRLKNSTMRNYDIEMWRYSKELKKLSTDPQLGHEHLANSKATLQSVEVRTNESGLRGAPLAELTPDARRVLFIGGSVTLGWGVKEEETVSLQTEHLLRSYGENVDVLNAGIGNYNTVRYVRLFLTHNKDLKPTDIVVHYLVKDAEVLKPEKANYLLSHSQLAATVWMGVMRLTSQYKGFDVEAYHRAVNQPESAGFKAMQASLAELAAYARQHGIRLYLAVIPDLRELQKYRLGFVHDALKQIAADNGYTYIDLFPALQGLGPDKIFVMPGDPHPSALGHELMAKAIAPVLHQDYSPK